MKSEFMIPLWYTIKRYMIRHQANLNKSVIAYFSSMLRDYIWIPIYAIFFLGGPTLFQLKGLIFHLIAFSIAYEIGYIYTDNISIKKENKKIRKVIYKNPVSDKIVYLSILLRLLVLAIILFFMQPWLNNGIIWLYVLVIAIYWIYGNVKEKFRIPFFLMLRFLKGFVPYAFLVLALSSKTITLILLLLLATSMFFTIEYASRKLDITYINVQLLEFTWLRYLIILIFVAPYVYFGRIGFQDFSLLFTIYISINIIMIILSYSKQVVIGKISFEEVKKLWNNY